MAVDVCFVYMIFKDEKILIDYRNLELGAFNEQLLVIDL